MKKKIFIVSAVTLLAASGCSWNLAPVFSDEPAATTTATSTPENASQTATSTAASSTDVKIGDEAKEQERVSPATGTATSTPATTDTVPATPITTENPDTPAPTAATSGSTAATQAVREISMESGSMSFKPNTLTLKLNEPVKLTITNAGFHDFTIDELGVQILMRGEGTYTGTFTPTKAGTFTFYCSVGEHRSLGMSGTVTVTE